jgi:AcrR family transcriptional regulator
MAGSRAAAAERRPGRPLEERVTTAILSAVIELVSEQGIGAVTMDAVAARAQVGKSAIYRRWPTKQELIIAAADTRLGMAPVPDLGSFRAEVRALLSARMAAYRMPGMARLLAGLMAVATEEESERERYGEYAARLTGGTRAILERGIARGDVRPDIEIRSVVTLIASPLVIRLVGEQGLPDERLVDDLVELIVGAAGAGS